MNSLAFDQILDSLPALISYLGTDLRYRYVNAAYLDWHQRKKENIIGIHVVDLLGPEAYAEMKPMLESVLAGHSISFERIFTYPIRAKRHMKVTYIPDFDQAKTVRGFSVIVSDIDDQKKLEEELRLSEKNYRDLFEHNPQPMCIWDRETFYFLEVNEAMVHHYGYSREEFLSMTVLDVRRPELREPFKAVLNERTPGYTMETPIFEHQKKNGETILVQNHVNDLLYKGRKCLMTQIRDITKSVKFEKEREGLVQELKDAVEARDEFLSIASHELRTPISSLQLQTLVLQDKLKELPESFTVGLVPFLESSQRQIDRLTRLVGNMLDFSRIAHGKLVLERENCDIALIIHEVLGRFAPEINRAQMRVRVQSELTSGNWDPYRLDQVMTNLVSNAIKFAPGAFLELLVEKKEQGVLLMVRDDGPGLEPCELSRIFQRFERATIRDHKSGLGLGLYICRQIIEAHQGRIWAESTPGKGTTFNIELPFLAKQTISI